MLKTHIHNYIYTYIYTIQTFSLIFPSFYIYIYIYYKSAKSSSAHEVKG